MTLLGSLRAPSPSPVLGSQPSHSNTLTSRASEAATSRQQPTIPTPRLATATPLAPFAGDDSILSNTSITSDGSFAAPLLPSKKAKRVLVPKKPLQASNQGTASTAGTSATISASRPATKSVRRTINDENSFDTSSEWTVVPPPPPPRTVGNPHQFASARRIAVAAPATTSQPRAKPEPVAILPVKTEDGSSKTMDRVRLSSTGASSVRTTTASVRSNSTLRTKKENTLHVYADDPTSQNTPVLVTKKKSRLALDLGWALGDKTNGQTREKEVNTPISATSTRAATPTHERKGSISRLTNILKSKSSTVRLSTGSTEDKENADATRTKTPTHERKGSISRLTNILKSKSSAIRLSMDSSEDKDKGKNKDSAESPDGDAEKRKWSIGFSRGQKQNSIREVFGGRRAKSPEPAPPAIINLASASGPVEYEYRTPSLDDHPPSVAPPPIEKDPVPSIPPTIRSVSAPLTSITTVSDRVPRPISVRIPNNTPARHHYRTFSADAAAILHPIESPIAMTRYEPDPDQTPMRRPGSPSRLRERTDESPVSPTDGPKYNSDSIAIRAMRSVRSMARLFTGPEDEEAEKEPVKLHKRRSRMTLKGLSVDGFVNPERRHSNSSQESWVAGTPSPSSAEQTAAPTPRPAPVPLVDRQIATASMRARMSTSNRPLSSESEAPPRPSVETFGTMRLKFGRRSGSTRRTLSMASNATANSAGTSESSDSGHGHMPGSRDASRRISTAGSGGRLSLFSALSSKSSHGNLTAKATPESMTQKTARKRGSLANLFDMAASMASSSGTRSRRSSRASKGSVESAGSRHSGGHEAPVPIDTVIDISRDRMEERIRTYNTLQTIPASPRPATLQEEDEISPIEADTITAPHITRLAIPSFEPSTLTRNATVSHGPSTSRAGEDGPRRMINHKRRAASEHWSNAWEVQERQPRLSNESSEAALSIVNAATSELGDLIHHLDLAGTPEATPIKAATPRRPRAFTTGDSPNAAPQDERRPWSWSPPKGSNTAMVIPPIMPTAPLSTVKSTFGRRIVRTETTNDQSPTDHILASRRSSTTAGSNDDSDSMFDSPLKGRGRKQSSASLLTDLGKMSTGTMLSAFGPRKGSNNSSGVVGDVSLTAFGPGQGNVSVEADNSDIPRELRDILSNRSQDTSLGSADANLFCDLSIPANASALMSSTHIESLLRPSSQTSHHKSSTPPSSVPAIPLPAQPKVSSDAALTVFDLVVEGVKKTATSALPTIESPSSQDLLGISTSAMHDHSLSTLDEEEPLSGSDGEDVTDHTGRSSFDFTQELNRLNAGGSRRSFVEELTSFKPSRPAPPQEMPPLPSLDFLRQIHDDDEEEPEIQKRNSTEDLALGVNPDSTMYAVANLDLSLLLSSPEPKKPSPPKSNGRKAEHLRAASLSESLDASMAALSSLKLSINQPSKPRPHSTSIESDVSKRHTRIAQARAYRKFKNLRERPLSTATTASFGSVVKPGTLDPFNYDFSGDESSVEGMERRQNHTMTSIPSISSYGALVNSGVRNPFGYDVTTDSHGRSAFLDQSVEMPRGANSRYSFASDRSSFYFDSSKLANRGQGDDSIMSRSRSSRPLPFRPGPRPDSLMSTNSHAWGHGSQGAHGGRTPWAKERHDPARDSILSELSFRRLSRPGLGDKMFESGPLYSIAGSPAQSSMCGEFGHDDSACQPLRSSYGSNDSRSLRFSVNSIFDKAASNTSSISSPSVFGYDESGVSASDSFLAAGSKPNFRPLSMFSMTSVCETSQEDDTMISMLGGGHTKVPRASLGSDVNGSPCVRAEKIRKAAGKLRRSQTKRESLLAGTSMSSAQSTEEEVSQEIVSRPRVSFEEPEDDDDDDEVVGGEPSAEDCVQIFNQPVSEMAWDPLDRQAESSANLFASQTSQATSPPTPPLCYASSADGSQSSIDVEKLKALLETSAPTSFNPDRLRPQGKGHRRRSYMSEMSRISIIESIAEEVTSENGSPRAPKFESLPEPSIRIWDPASRRSSWRSSIDWESDTGVLLREYFSLQTEARQTVQESQDMWLDTDFSRFALTTFDPPRNPAAIKALLEHSQRNFIPLPSELCVRKPRSRANSRPSPYPRGPAKTISGQPFRRHGRTPSVESALNCISPFSHPLPSAAESGVAPSLETYAPLSPFSVNYQSVAVPSPEKVVQGPVPSLCSMIESDAKRNALGRRVGKPVDKTNTSKLNEWSFGGNKSVERKSTEVLGNKSASKSRSFISSSASAKENKEREAQGTLTKNTTLRLSRARPPRRPTAAAILAPTTLRV